MAVGRSKRESMANIKLKSSAEMRKIRLPIVIIKSNMNHRIISGTIWGTIIGFYN